MRYRALVIVPGLPFTDEEAWQPVISHLERERQELGPSIGWEDLQTACFALATSAADEESAARIAYAAVCTALEQAGAPTRCPINVEVEAA